MSWNNVMPPTMMACSKCMNACGVTDVVCHLSLHQRVCVCEILFIYVYPGWLAYLWVHAV